MKKSIFLIILISVLVLSGCKSLFTREGNLLSDAKQAERRGDYNAAVLSAVESIRIDNKYKNAIEFLKDLYPRANSYYALKIDEKRSAGGNFANDDIALYYKNLHSINETVKTLPPIIDPKTKMQLSFTYTDYSAELAAANELAAEDHYLEGIKFLKLKGRENAKSAVKEFETALRFLPGYKDAENKIQAAMEEGTQVLAFFPFVNNAWNIPAAQFTDIVSSSIVSTLMNDRDVMKFTKIVDRDMQDRIIEEQLGSLNAMMDDRSRVEIGQLLNSNIIITGTIDDARIEGPSTTMTQYNRKAEITVEESRQQTDGYYKNENSGSLSNDSSENSSYYKDGTSSSDGASGADSDTTVYGTKVVEANVFYYRKAITFSVTVSYKAVDVESGTILKSDTVNILSEDSSEWAEWSGNEAALTAEDKKLIDTYEQSVMSAQQVSTQAAKQAGGKIAEGLSTFLK